MLKIKVYANPLSWLPICIIWSHHEFTEKSIEVLKIKYPDCYIEVEGV